MTSTPTPIAPKDSTPLLEKSDLVSQTSHSPLPSEVASDLLREKLATRYPALNIDPDKTLVATPQWRVVDDHVEMESVEFLSLTHTLVLQSLYGTTANYLEGEHFLTLESDANDPVHLAVSIEDIAQELNDSVPQLFVQLQKRQLDYWNQTGQKIPRWQELSDSLRKALNVQTVKGWDVDECMMAREVFEAPDKAARKKSNSGLSAIQACLIDIDTVKNTVASHLLIGGALVLKATCRERELLVMYTIERGYESFSSMEQLGNSLPARLEESLEGFTMTWRLFEPDGNVFDHMAWALISSQLDAIALIGSLENPVEDDTELESGLDETEHARLMQLHAAIPDWLRNASPKDIQDYSRYITALGKLYRQPEHKAARNEIPSIIDFAQRLMAEAIIADTRAVDAATLPLNELRINITNSFTSGNFTLPNPLDHRTETLAEFAMENQAPYMATVSFLHGQSVPPWLTPAFLTTLAAQVNIGEAYPALIKRKLIDERVESRRQENFYCDQLRLLLPLLALEGKVKQEAGIDELGYRFICELLDSDTEKAHSIAIYPLKLTPQHRLISSSDSVENMFLISPRNAESGPCLLYRPMQDLPLLQFPSRQNLLYALHQPGELRDSVLAWLPDNTLSYEYDQYVLPTGLPSPWIVAEQLVNPFKQAQGFGQVTSANDEITGNVLSALFKSNARALVDLADRQSQSNAERRWTLLKESSWALFAVTSNFLTGAVGTAVWVWQTINEIQQAIDASNRGDTFIEWTSLSDLLLITGIVLSHHAAMRRNTLSGKPRLARPSLEKPTLPGGEPVTVQFDPAPLVAELAPGHRSSLEVAGSVPRRTPAALGTYLDTFKVAAIDITDRNVTKVNEKPPHLYQHNDRNFAQVGERWFQVMVSGEDPPHIVDPDEPNRSGPLLTHNARGEWFIDLRLRLRGGGGNAFSKPLVAANEMRFKELEESLTSFSDQQKVLEDELSTLQTDMQKSTQEHFESLSKAYAQKLEVTITAYRQALEKLREWRTLGGSKNYVHELLRISTSLQKNLSLWFVIKRTEYAQATRMMTDTGQTEPMPLKTYVANIQVATDLSQEMVEKLELSHSTIECLRAAGRSGIERANEIKKLAPSFNVLDLKTNEIGMAQELCLEDKASPLMPQARDAVGKIIVSAAKAASQVADMAAAGDNLRPLQSRIEALDSLIETFADADQRLQELPDAYPDLLKPARLLHLRGLIGEFAQLVQNRLQALLPQPPKPLQKATTSSRQASYHQPAKVRKTRPKAPAKSEPGTTAQAPLTPIAPMIRQQPASTLSDEELIAAAMDLNLDTSRFIERTAKDALRPRRIPADIQDLFDQQALKLEQGADSVDQAVLRSKKRDGEPLPVATLSLEMRAAARQLREEGISVRAKLYKLRKPTQTAFKWMHEHQQVDVAADPRGRIQTTGMGDFFQEYRILDKANGKTIWVAHFHYESLVSPADQPTAAHLKIADDYLKTLSPDQQTALNAFEPIDGVLRKLVDPDLRKLFWDMEPKAKT